MTYCLPGGYSCNLDNNCSGAITINIQNNSPEIIPLVQTATNQFRGQVLPGETKSFQVCNNTTYSTPPWWVADWTQQGPTFNVGQDQNVCLYAYLDPQQTLTIQSVDCSISAVGKNNGKKQ